MGMICKAFSKQLFGVRYGRLGKMLLADLIVFWSLHISGLQIGIRPAILYLMVSVFTAGVMWQALSSEDNVQNMKNILMLPCGEKGFTAAYVFTLGAYTLFMRTGTLLAVVFAVAPWSPPEVAGSILCACNAIAMTACIYSRGKYRGAGAVWAGAFVAFLFRAYDTGIFLPVVVGNALAAILFLGNTEAYRFYDRLKRPGRRVKPYRRHCVWRYLLRYLMDHKNYFINMAALGGVACVLPMLFGRMEGIFVLPVGFAILSLNTPVCILLSCDPALERAVRFLPGQRRAFGAPYCLFIFLCNLAADCIYLISWRLQVGSMAGIIPVTAVCFALQSAIASVLLEWNYPLQGWRIESDLWHHPRKYIVPVMMMLAAGIVGTVPRLMYVLFILLAAEGSILFWMCRRD